MHLEWRDVPAGPDGPVISTSVQPLEAAELARLAAGKTVLEVGSAYGYSACVMALAGAETVTAVDMHTWIAGSFEVMTANLEAHAVDGDVVIVRVPSQAALPQMAADGARFGLIFIDGDHSAEAVRHDGEWAAKLLEPGGTIAFHDYGEDCCCAGVRHAVDALYPEGGTVTGTLFTVTPKPSLFDNGGSLPSGVSLAFNRGDHDEPVVTL
jgi:tRNA G37 N-methylase Trm5